MRKSATIIVNTANEIRKLLICSFAFICVMEAPAVDYYTKNIDGLRYRYENSGPANLKVITSVGSPDSNPNYPDSVVAFDGTELVVNSKIDSIFGIAGTAFKRCTKLKSVTIPSNVVYIAGTPFAYLTNLEEVYFEGDAPDVSSDIFFGASSRLVVKVKHGTIGWNGGVSASLPDTWCGRAITYTDETYDWPNETARNETTVNMIVSNVVIHVVQQSITPTFAFPASNDMGFVNIITEVKNNGIASIPISWAMSYPNYTATFGSDFTASLMKPTGKKDAAGKDMLVWQDYVAGTDPTDVNDVLRASITLVDDNPVISYTPELDDERKAMRKYTIYGKECLTDTEWTELEPDAISGYNFFKVTVEMK